MRIEKHTNWGVRRMDRELAPSSEGSKKKCRDYAEERRLHRISPLLCLETPGEMDRFGEESGGISWTGTGLMRKKGKGGGAGKPKGSAGPKKITTDQRPPFPMKISNSDQTTPPKRPLNWTAPDVTPNIPPFWT